MRTNLLSTSRGPAWSLCLLALLMAGPVASATPGSMDEALQALVNPGLASAPDDAASLGQDPADLPAEEPPEGGVRAWIEAMDGETLTVDQLAAIQEIEETHREQLALIEELSVPEPLLAYYQDPRSVLKVDPLFLDRVDLSEFDIPIAINDDVAKWVRYFNGNGRKYYQRWLDRSTRYRPMMIRELEAAGLPRDLVYLSMIESGYNPHAYSSADAAGLWQFIPSTAKLYHMRVDWWVDDRRDPEVSTRAAIALLTDLHKMFKGNWYLAWAGYNTGPGRVMRASKRANSTDFWTITEQSLLANETENYVPKIIAAAIIGKHPERYGFVVNKGEPELRYDVAKVDGSVELSVLAKAAGTDLATLQALNPALRRHATPDEGYTVRLPTGRKDAFVAALASIPRAERVSYTRHTVKRGEALSVIAAKYGVSSSDLVAANKLANANRIFVGMQLVIPVRGAPAAASPPSAGRSTVADVRVEPARATIPTTTVVVASGDTLSGIAAKHGVTTASIRSNNGLTSDKIVVGQKLVLTNAAKSAATPRVHVVASGESLSVIAAKYGVSQADLQRWNKITNSAHIRIGQQLTVHGASAPPAPAWSSYTVKPGDSLGRIAQQHGCTVADLQQWNKLSGTVIRPGQALKIKTTSS